MDDVTPVNAGPIADFVEDVNQIDTLGVQDMDVANASAPGYPDVTGESPPTTVRLSCPSSSSNHLIDHIDIIPQAVSSDISLLPSPPQATDVIEKFITGDNQKSADVIGSSQTGTIIPSLLASYGPTIVKEFDEIVKRTDADISVRPCFPS